MTIFQKLFVKVIPLQRQFKLKINIFEIDVKLIALANNKTFYSRKEKNTYGILIDHKLKKILSKDACFM